MDEIRRLISIGVDEINNPDGQNPIILAAYRVFPEAKIIHCNDVDLGFNFANDSLQPHQGCFYITLPDHIFAWLMQWNSKRDNPDSKIKVLPITFGVAFSASFVRANHQDSISNDPSKRPTTFDP